MKRISVFSYEYMERLLYKELLRWKGDAARKPLIIRGARQVGKTYLLEEFGAREFAKTLRLNFERYPRLGRIFERDLSVERIVGEIEVEFNTTVDRSNTLIVFDEVQECPRALTSLKYFCESDKPYFVACAGSLLGVKVGGGSFPVGKVHFLDLFPLSFQEFLRAAGEEKLAELLTSLETIKPIPEHFHEKCLEYLRLYFCIGGMPEVVKGYVEKRNLHEVREVQRDLLETYANDFSKHAGKGMAIRIGQVWESIPKQLSRGHGRFRFSEMRKGARFKEYEEAISWLTHAKLCHKIQLVKRPELPLAHFGEEGFFRLIMLDVGLLGALSQLPPKTLLQENDLFKTFKGAFAESLVGQELVSFGIGNLYYWQSQHEAEVDYLVELGGSIFPVEVKSGESGKLKSLKVYADRYSPPRRVRISARNFHVADDFVNLPLYDVERLALFRR